ncbi:MAG: helix-turn-helix domain-containing protein [Eubacteriales bacterium]|nr:helix-turn-helix domain-containing protein [Eubacteriales bacterium]
MKSTFSFFHSSIFRKFLLSFLAAFVLPISLVFGYLEYTNQKLLTREIYDLQETTANYTRRTMDFEFSRYRTFSATLLNNANINSIRKKTYDELTPADALRLMDLRGMLSSFAVDSTVVSRIFLYIPASNLYVDAVRALPLEDALYTLEDSGLMPGNSDQWQAMLTQTYTSQWLNTVNRKGDTVLYYIQTLPSAFDRDTCNLMIAVNPTYLREVFDESNLSENEWIGMVDDTGSVIYSPVQNTPDFTSLTGLGDSGSVTQNNLLYTYCHSKQTRTYYFSVLPLENISNSLRGSNSLSIAVLLISFLICTVITYLTTVRNFKPIAYLSTLAQPDADDPDVDEFTRLKLSLMELSDEKRLRTDQAKYARQVLDDQRLIRNMLKAGNQAALEKRMQREDLAPVGSAWVLSIVTLVDYSNEEADTQTSYQRTMTQLHDSFSAVGSQFYTALPLYDDKELLVLVNLPSDELQHLAYLRNSFTNLLHMLRSSFSIDCQIAVSAIHNLQTLNGQALTELISEARIAAESPAEGESILFYSTQAVDKVMHISVEHTMNRLMHACLRGATDETDKLMKQLAEQVRTLSEYQSGSEKEIDTYEDESTEMRIKRDILEIVKNEYPNPMLNVSAIADKLGKNVDYISRVFKQTTTIGLLDYIHHMRIKAAKELLIGQPNLSIVQISQRVGYFGADSFIRSFKRIEGTTPGRYRTQKKGE